MDYTGVHPLHEEILPRFEFELVRENENPVRKKTGRGRGYSSKLNRNGSCVPESKSRGQRKLLQRCLPHPQAYEVAVYCNDLSEPWRGEDLLDDFAG